MAGCLIRLSFIGLLPILPAPGFGPAQSTDNPEKFRKYRHQPADLDLTNLSAARMRQGLTGALASQDQGIRLGNRTYWIQKAMDWRRAVVQHTPGKADASAVEIGHWSEGDLEIVIGFVKERTPARMDQKKHPMFRSALSSNDSLPKDIARHLRRGRYTIMHRPGYMMEGSGIKRK